MFVKHSASSAINYTAKSLQTKLSALKITTGFTESRASRVALNPLKVMLRRRRLCTVNYGGRQQPRDRENRLARARWRGTYFIRPVNIAAAINSTPSPPPGLLIFQRSRLSDDPSRIYYEARARSNEQQHFVRSPLYNGSCILEWATRHLLFFFSPRVIVRIICLCLTRISLTASPREASRDHLQKHNFSLQFYDEIL